MNVHRISMVKEDKAEKGLSALQEVLKEEGFTVVKSEISVGMTHFKQKYYVSPTDPGTFIVITELVFHLQIEAVRLRGDAKPWLLRYLKNSERKLKAA